jgi:hypothetical protein
MTTADPSAVRCLAWCLESCHLAPCRLNLGAQLLYRGPQRLGRRLLARSKLSCCCLPWRSRPGFPTSWWRSNAGPSVPRPLQHVLLQGPQLRTQLRLLAGHLSQRRLRGRQRSGKVVKHSLRRQAALGGVRQRGAHRAAEALIQRLVGVRRDAESEVGAGEHGTSQAEERAVGRLVPLPERGRRRTRPAPTHHPLHVAVRGSDAETGGGRDSCEHTPALLAARAGGTPLRWRP